MADRCHSDRQEKIELIRYQPCSQDSGDLEAATKTITAISKPGTPDYTANLTTPTSPDPRLIVKRLGHRLLIHIDSFDGTPAATKLYYSIEVNGVERATGEFTSTGDNIKAWALTEGQFNMGNANTLAIFLWVDQGSAVVSLCQLWQAVGVHNAGYSHETTGTIITMKHKGMIIPQAVVCRIGTGTPNLAVLTADVWEDEVEVKVVSGQYAHLNFEGITMSTDELVIRIYDTIATDLVFVHSITFVTSSKQ